MRSIIHWLLRFCSKKILKKYKPEVIAITGSVGKTSAREAIFSALTHKFRVRQAIRSYNDQIGVPMTIVGMESPGRSITGWVAVFYECLRLIFSKDENYPEMLIVEMGADRPGDIQYLLEFCPPKVGVLTAIAPTHVEYFKTVERVAKEKQLVLTSLTGDCAAILNSDDERVLAVEPKIKCQMYTFGFGGDAMIQGSDAVVSYSENSKPNGINFRIAYGGSNIPMFLPNVLGRQHIYPALSAVAVGLFYGMNMIEISEGLKQYTPAPGRMHVVSGIKNTTIIDDTYNSSPVAANAALKVLSEIKLPEGADSRIKPEKYLVLGDMLELGPMTEDEHRKLGYALVEAGVDFLVTVGEAAKHIAIAAQEAGFEEHRIAKFADSMVAGKFIQEKIKQGDLILVKGSAAMRMEKIVKEVMAHPLESGRLLARQYGKWLNT